MENNTSQNSLAKDERRAEAKCFFQRPGVKSRGRYRQIFTGLKTSS
jgi:hypothetical protein